MKILVSLALTTAFASTAAFAQAPAGAPVAQSAVPATTPTQAPAADSAAQPVPGQPGAAPQPATTAQAAPTANTQVASVIEAGFPKYDVDKSGTLSSAEFKQWIADLKTSELAAEGKPNDKTVVTQYASAALKSADKDSDKSVSKEELTAFLGG